VNKEQLYEMISELLDEAQWGGFTGGAAPLDEPPLDSGPMSPEQQQKVFDILVDTGSDPEELKASGDYPDVVEENIMNIKNIIREELKVALNEQGAYDDQRGSLKQITDYANDVDNLASNLVAADGEPHVSNTMDYIRRQMSLIKELVKQHRREMEGE
tara:strand:+ start:195 stop:668 length:474 start_codon:yes stop_codon:yes gene_type:complete